MPSSRAILSISAPWALKVVGISSMNVMYFATPTLRVWGCFIDVLDAIGVTSRELVGFEDGILVENLFLGATFGSGQVSRKGTKNVLLGEIHPV